MFRGRWLSGALVLALLLPVLPVLPVQAAEVSVCSGIECSMAAGDANTAGSLDPDGVAAWVAEQQITGLDPHHWAAPALVQLAGSQLLVVRPGDHLDLNGPLTLWQAAPVMMNRAQKPMAGLSPREVAVRAAELGLIPGPVPAEDRPMTRLEAAYMLGRVTQFTGAVEQRADLDQIFTDAAAIPAASRALVYWVSVENRLFIGYPDRTFRPDEPFTLGQFVVLMQRLRAFWPEPEPELQGG